MHLFEFLFELIGNSGPLTIPRRFQFGCSMVSLAFFVAILVLLFLR